MAPLPVSPKLPKRQSFLANPDKERIHCNRREFITAAAMATANLTMLSGCKSLEKASAKEIIDIHQHAGYSGRSDEELIEHQNAMGVSRTILLPSAKAMVTPATLNGLANGLQAGARGNEACYRLAKAFPRKFYFAANEVPDAPASEREAEKYLKLGAVAIAEQKFGVECDSAGMQRLYAMAADYGVPILMHWQHGMYNHGFDRFAEMLEKYPRTVFIGHAQTWWANIDLNHKDQKTLYPKGAVIQGGLTDRYLGDYPNVYGDLSAGSGLNSLRRDEEHARGFIERHQDKLLFGTDCPDRVGIGSKCLGWQIIQAVRQLSPDEEITRKILSLNARRVFHL